MFVRICLVILISLLLGGCETAKQYLVPDVLKHEKPRLYLDHPVTPELEDYEFVIITPENSEEKFKELVASGNDPVVWALSDSHYQAVIRNNGDVQTYILQQKSTIEAYKNYYEPVEPVNNKD